MSHDSAINTRRTKTPGIALTDETSVGKHRRRPARHTRWWVANTIVPGPPLCLPSAPHQCLLMRPGERPRTASDNDHSPQLQRHHYQHHQASNIHHHHHGHHHAMSIQQPVPAIIIINILTTKTTTSNIITITNILTTAPPSSSPSRRKDVNYLAWSRSNPRPPGYRTR